jgi:hypothetical protein
MFALLGRYHNVTIAAILSKKRQMLLCPPPGNCHAFATLVPRVTPVTRPVTQSLQTLAQLGCHACVDVLFAISRSEDTNPTQTPTQRNGDGEVGATLTGPDRSERPAQRRASLRRPNEASAKLRRPRVALGGTIFHAMTGTHRDILMGCRVRTQAIA